ncbi:heme receptor HasR [Vibrio cholerae]|nr:heme receptor HasR [Vibrio cholerae]
MTDRYQVRPGSVVSMPDSGRTITLGFECETKQFEQFTGWC